MSSPSAVLSQQCKSSHHKQSQSSLSQEEDGQSRDLIKQGKANVFQTSQGYTDRPCLRKQKQNNKKPCPCQHLIFVSHPNRHVIVSHWDFNFQLNKFHAVSVICRSLKMMIVCTLCNYAAWVFMSGNNLQNLDLLFHHVGSWRKHKSPGLQGKLPPPAAQSWQLLCIFLDEASA